MGKERVTNSIDIEKAKDLAYRLGTGLSWLIDYPPDEDKESIEILTKLGAKYRSDKEIHNIVIVESKDDGYKRKLNKEIEKLKNEIYQITSGEFGIYGLYNFPKLTQLRDELNAELDGKLVQLFHLNRKGYNKPKEKKKN